MISRLFYEILSGKLQLFSICFFLWYYTWLEWNWPSWHCWPHVLSSQRRQIIFLTQEIMWPFLAFCLFLYCSQCSNVGGEGGKSEIGRVWKFDSWQRCEDNISAIIGLWKELSKRKVFKKQLIVCIKRLRQFCGIKKKPKKTRVVRTTCLFLPNY